MWFVAAQGGSRPGRPPTPHVPPVGDDGVPTTPYESGLRNVPSEPGDRTGRSHRNPFRDWVPGFPDLFGTKKIPGTKEVSVTYTTEDSRKRPRSLVRPGG